MATAWSSRSSAYKFGVGGLLVGFLCYLVGFALPFWLTAGNMRFGLWLICFETRTRTEIKTECRTTISRSGVESWNWFQAVQALECVGLAGLVASSLFAVITNCRHAIPPQSRSLEALSALGGAFGFIGCMIFVAKTHEIYDAIEQYYSWGFGLNLAGSILAVIAAVTIATGNRSTLPNQATAGTAMHTGETPTMQGGNTVVMQQQGVVYPAALGAQPAAYGYDQGVSVTAQYPGGFPPAPPQAGYYAAPAAAYGGNN